MVSQQTLHRPALYILAGLLQWLVDTAIMIVLSHAGIAVALATVAGRLAGAACGYLFNARITFAAPGSPSMRQTLPRFVAFWLLATTVSAAMLAAVDALAGLHTAWLGKPAVDGLMALAGYLASRHWIYRSEAV